MNVNFLRSVFFVNFNFECCFFFKLFGIIVDEVSGVFWEFNFKFEVVYVWVNFYCEQFKVVLGNKCNVLVIYVKDFCVFYIGWWKLGGFKGINYQCYCDDCYDDESFVYSGFFKQVMFILLLIFLCRLLCVMMKKIKN